jgi:hypothetical protein
VGPERALDAEELQCGTCIPVTMLAGVDAVRYRRWPILILTDYREQASLSDLQLTAGVRIKSEQAFETFS